MDIYNKKYIMKKIVRLTENDLMRIVKRVIREENQNTLFKKQFKQFSTIGKPKIYETGDFISLNWNDPNQPGNNILTLTYREGEDDFDIILTDELNGEFCERLKNASSFLKQNGGNGNYRNNTSNCGGQFFFGVENFDSLKEILPKLHLAIFKK